MRGPNVGDNAGDAIIYVGAASMFRDGLGLLLANTNSSQLVGTFDTAAEAIVVASKLRPQVALLDLGVPVQAHISAITSLKSALPGLAVLVLANARDQLSIRAVFAAAADAYLHKDEDHAELLFAIECLMRGRTYVSSSVCHLVISGFIESCALPNRTGDGLESLTKREQQVMRMIALGNRTREIAYRLNLSPKTIEKHRMSLMRKLGVNSAPAVAAYAITHGYVSL